MRKGKFPALFLAWLAFVGALAAGLLLAPAAGRERHYYLGFDRNYYPGDAALGQLRKTFSYAGYWLSPPPGAKSNSWSGKRATVARHGFGFLLLFNGKLYRELRAAGNARLAGRQDGTAAVKSARAEGFRREALIFLDQEEGGVMLPEQLAYIEAWSEAVRKGGYAPGIYCSGMPVAQKDAAAVTTAADLQAKLGTRIKIWVANDECPPSPGCSYEKVPAPSASGTENALVWQFAQSPRRRQFTEACAASYATDGRCYAPGMAHGEDSFVDLNTSSSPDPSKGR